MRIMVDTNIILAAAVFGSKWLLNMIDNIVENHYLVISSGIVDELYDVVRRKAPEQMEVLEKFIWNIKCKFVYSPEKVEEKDRLFKIRDEKDYIILHTAIIENVDIFITNDNDFFDVDIKRPKIIKPQEFNEKY